MFKPKTPISAVFASPKGGIERDGRLDNSSGAWIRTKDLRVMREKPDFGNFDRITMQISQLYVLRFRRLKQSAIGCQFSYSMPFGGESQACFKF